MSVSAEAETGDGSADLLALARVAVSDAPLRALGLADRAVSAANPGWERALACQIRSRALRALGRHEEALTAFTDAAKEAESGGNLRLAAQVQVGAVDTLGMLGRYEDAAALAESLVQRLTVEGAILDAARVLGNLGSIHLRRDRYDNALRVYAAAESLLASIPVTQADGDAAEVSSLRAGLLINRAIALTYQGQQDAAASLYAQARTLYERQGLAFEAAVAASNLGFLHYTAGRHAAALAELTASYTVFARSGRIHEAARCDLDTGDTYRALNLLAEARLCYERALRTFETLPLDDDAARAHLGAAAIAAREGRIGEARTALDTAEAHFAAIGNAVLRAHVRLCRADLMLHAGEASAARAEANRAGRVFARAGLAGWAAEARLIAAGTCTGPKADSDSAAVTLRRIAKTARETRRGWLECRSESALGQLYRRRGEPKAALRHLRRAVEALEAVRTQIAPEDLHLAFLRDKETPYSDLVTHLLEGRPGETEVAEALDAVERSRSRLLLERLLSAQASPPAPSVDSVDPGEKQDDLRERLSDLRARLARSYRDALSLSPEEQSRHGETTGEAALVALECDYARTLREAEIRGGFGETTLKSAPSRLPELQASLADDEALVLYCVVGGDRLAAFVLTRSRRSVQTNLAAWSDVTRTVRRFRYHLQKVGSRGRSEGETPDTLTHEINGVLERLQCLLIAPLESALGGIRRLVVVPCGVLHGVPFHALPSAGDGGLGLLADRFEIVCAPSASVWHALVRRADAPTPRGVTEKPVLVGLSGPGTENVARELAVIARQMPSATTSMFCGDDATIRNVCAAAPTATLLHLATHALFRRDNSLFSGLQLADDWLLGRDLYGMRLEAELVTLSACDTGAAGIEPGEEWMGLARGFLTAGARRVLVSLWPADDAATAELMAAFYRYIGEGVRPASALRQAQAEIRARWPHPYFWAAFCLIGQQ